MNIKELQTKYKLEKADFWECHGNWIVSHNAVEKIMAIEKINLYDMVTLFQSETTCRMKIICHKLNEDNQLISSITTIGEAGKENCTSKYYGAMAEKRGIDRAVLKLINAYEYGIYSDVEADDFKKGRTPEEQIQSYNNQSQHVIEETLSDKQHTLLSRLITEENFDLLEGKTIPSLTKTQASELISKLMDKEKETK